jgi:hypothetical protein
MRLFILKLLLSLPFFIAIPVNSSDPSESELEQGASSSSKRSRKEFEESATPQVGNKHPRKSYIEEYEEREAKGYEDWQQRYQHSNSLTPDRASVSDQERDHASRRLQHNAKPLAYRGEVYLGQELHKQGAHPLQGVGTSYVGSSHKNYIQRDDEEGECRYEAYGVPQAKEPQIDQGAYRRKEPEFIEVYSLLHKRMMVDKARDKRYLKADDEDVIFDAGHGIDHAITITHKESNSTRDNNNYTPQNAYYNRHIRMPLVQHGIPEGAAYKEIAVYPEIPLLITRKSGTQQEQHPVPEGFLFTVLDSAGKFIQSYYFPNFHHYQKEKAQLPQSQTAWKSFAEKFKVPQEVVQDIWGHETIDNQYRRRLAQWKSEMVGYRSLTGRYKVLPNAGWSPAARNALIRTAAIYRMERAAEYDTTVENMLQIAKLFNDKEFRYEEFKGTLYCPHRANYWTKRALEEVQRKGYTPEDISHFMFYYHELPLQAGSMDKLISCFEERLSTSQTVGSQHIARVLQYFEENQQAEKYREWSHRLSQLVREQKILGSVVIAEHSSLAAIVDTDILNIILDFEITKDNIAGILEGFKQRAIREQSEYNENLKFLELPHISEKALHLLFSAFENGIKHEGQKLYVDVTNAAIKLSEYERGGLQLHVKKCFPKTKVTILN